MNKKFTPKLSLEQFEVWENDMKYIFELVEKNEDRMGEILYNKNIFYWLFHQSEFNRLVKENEKLLDFSESKFEEL